MIPLSLQKRTVILGIAFILFPLLIFLFVILPIQHSQKRLVEMITQSREKSQSQLSLIQNLLQGGKQKSDGNAEWIEKAFLDASHPIDFIFRLEALANEAGIDPVFQFEKEIDPKAEDAQINTLSISANGSLSQLLPFLRSLEQEPTYVNITRISLKKDLSLQSEDLGEPSIELKAYAQTFWK